MEICVVSQSTPIAGRVAVPARDGYRRREGGAEGRGRLKVEGRHMTRAFLVHGFVMVASLSPSPSPSCANRGQVQWRVPPMMMPCRCNPPHSEGTTSRVIASWWGSDRKDLTCRVPDSQPSHTCSFKTLGRNDLTCALSPQPWNLPPGQFGRREPHEWKDCLLTDEYVVK